jgi:hypothetical protein
MPYSTHFLLHTSTYFTIPTPHIPLHRSSLTPHIPHSIFTNLPSPYSTHPSLHLHQPHFTLTPHIPHSIFTNLHFTLLHTFPTPLSPLLPHSQTHSKISLLKTTQISSTSTPYGSSWSSPDRILLSSRLLYSRGNGTITDSRLRLSRNKKLP